MEHHWPSGGENGRSEAVASPAASTATPLPAGEIADLVLLNGKVITIDPADTIAQAVAIQGGSIRAIGTDAQIRAMMGPATQTLDLAGRAVTPGLIDAHCHLQVQGLMNTWYVPFLPPEVKTMDDLRGKLAEVVAKTPKGEWIQGFFLAGRVIIPAGPVWLRLGGGERTPWKRI